jgi:hypothetical protein
MSGLSDIVSITISRETKVPSRQGFGYANFVSSSTTFTGGSRIRSYTSLAEVSADTDVDATAVAFATSYFAQNPRPRKLYITECDLVTVPETFVEALQAAQLIDDDWYGVAIESRDSAIVAAVAAWVETQTKLFATASDAANILTATTTSNIAYTLKNAGYDRSLVIYHSDAATDWPEAALLGLQFAKTPGSSTYVYKTLAGISADSLTSAQKGYAHSYNAFTYTTRAGINMTEGGKVASGEWVDVIVGIDDLTIDMETKVFGKLANAEKIPYTMQGVLVIVGAINESLTRSVNNSVLAADPAPFVTYPEIADISDADKGNRILPDVEFEAVLAGAIHKATISGRVVL